MVVICSINMAQRNYDNAIECKEVVELAPKNIRSYLTAGKLYQRRKKFTIPAELKSGFINPGEASLKND